jgi:hypothetical protein
VKARAPGCSGNRPFKPSTVPVRHVCAEISETHFVRLSPQAFNRSRELLQAGQFVENEYDDGISSCDYFAGIDIPVFSLLAKLLYEVLEVDYIYRSRCVVSFPVLVNRFLDIAYTNLGGVQNQDITEFCNPSMRR